MDEYNSWSQEDEDVSPEGGMQASYLDSDDVQLREPDADDTNKLQTCAISFEEELAKLRRICKGMIFIFFSMHQIHV